MQHEAGNPVRNHLDRMRGAGQKALCQFLIAGDPTPELAGELAMASVDAGVDLVEFCIPFLRSITDGPVIQAGYDRALAGGMTTARALEAMSQLARHVPVVLLADYRATIAGMGVDPFLSAAADYGAGAVLMHGLPPLLQDSACAEAKARGLGVVATAYPQSSDQTVAVSARRGSAFLYLVSGYGRSGAKGGGRTDADQLATHVARMRAAGAGPVGVGFGIRDADDHRAVFRAGADLSITGSALTALVAEHGHDPGRLRREWTAALNGIAQAKQDWASPQPDRRNHHV
ncbi:tryptophan synthase subunit alpha [Paracoccus sp. (in: a-proteobacteria)]|uniref:tryptophan synthase subunit alpha n=1 Tax=Paracoccus sp. TaxID=267 RepID=UPI003A84BE4F